MAANRNAELRVDLKVFLVEDLHGMRGLLADLFSSLGGLTLAGYARTEAEAKLWLDEHAGEWDVAIVDLVLDQGSGMEVLRRCRAEPGGGKVVIFSSYATPGVRRHCLELGAAAVFDKSETTAFIGWFSALRDQEHSNP
jgi:DNA-binding NarL/FixJ family response regulator